MKGCSGLYFIVLFNLFIAPANASLMDLKKLATKNFLMAKTTTGCMPKGMKVDPIGNSLYVAEMCGKINSITKKRVATASIYDLDKRSLSSTLVTPLGVKNGGILGNTEIAFSLDQQWGFITRPEGDRDSEIYKNFGLLSVVNTDTQKIVKYIPLLGSGSKIIEPRPYLENTSTREQIIYVANYFSDNISVVDVTHLKEDGNLDGKNYFVSLIPLHSNFTNLKSKPYQIAPRGIAFTSDGKYALVLATETGSLLIIDAIKHQQIAELPPIDFKTSGRELNLRHIVVTKDGEMAYLSHMRGNSISRISLPKLIGIINNLTLGKKSFVFPASIWDQIIVPFNTENGPAKILVLEDYPSDHPNFPGKKWPYAHPNTIVLDPVKNRYLFVSHRTTTNADDSRVDPKIKGKIDIIDTQKGKVVFSLVGGSQPTALDISHDGENLYSAGLIDDTLYFYNIKKIIDLYELGES